MDPEHICLRQTILEFAFATNAFYDRSKNGPMLYSTDW